MDAVVRDHPARAGAALAGGAIGTEQDAAHGQVEVGAGRDDDGVVATQLEQAAAESRRHPWPDRPAHPGRPGGRDQRHARVVDQRLTDGSAAVEHLRQVGRRILAKAVQGALEQGLGGQRRQRGFLARLPDHRVAADQRQRRVPGPDRDGEVECADHADDAQRMPDFHHPVARPLTGDRQPVQLA